MSDETDERLGQMRKIMVAAAVILPLQAYAQTGDRWLCIADLSTGFGFVQNGGKWEAQKFTVHDDRFIIHRPVAGNTLSDKMKWVVTRVGEKSPTAYCPAEFSGTYLQCPGMTTFKFSQKTLRFQATYDFGYVEPINEGSDTPSITIGKCSPI